MSFWPSSPTTTTPSSSPVNTRLRTLSTSFTRRYSEKKQSSSTMPMSSLAWSGSVPSRDAAPAVGRVMPSMDLMRVVFTVPGKGCFVAAQNRETRREAVLCQIEEHLSQAVDAAKAGAVELDEHEEQGHAARAGMGPDHRADGVDDDLFHAVTLLDLVRHKPPMPLKPC